MSEELIKLLTEARDICDTVSSVTSTIYAHRKNEMQVMREIEALQRLLTPHRDRIDSALAAQQEPTEPVAMEGYWWCPNCKAEIGAYHVTYQEYHEDCGHKVEWITPDTAPLSGVRAGMLRAAEICKEWEAKLSQGAGYAIRTAREAITRAADQPDTRPGTPLILTMETLDQWHQIIHDDSLERGDRLQRIAARINVIQDSVKRAADQVNADESYSAGVDRDRAAGIYRDTVPLDQVNTAPAVQVPMIGKMKIRWAPRDCIKDSPTKANPSPIRIVLVSDIDDQQPGIAFNADAMLRAAQEAK